jgi:hypothetical protein
VACVPAVLLCGLPVYASLLTDLSQLPLNHQVIDLQQFAGTGYFFTDGPQQVGPPGDVLFTATNPDLSVLGDGSYDLGVNGSWGSPITYAAIDFDLLGGDPYSMTFTFDTLMDGVAALMNYRAPTQSEINDGISYSDVLIEALDSSNGVLESYDITESAPISTPGALNAGAYRGIVRGAADIQAFRVSNAGAILTNLSFSSPEFPGITPAPEPSTVFGSAAALFIASILRFRNRN